MKSANDVIYQQVTDALQALNIRDTSLAGDVITCILNQVVYWEKPLSDDKRLLFVRLFSPVIMREEVFLGNVLLNAFLAQSFAHAVKQSQGEAVLVANDLENYYYLVCYSDSLHALEKCFYDEVLNNLSDLFFCETDEVKGIFGSIETMLDFEKANVEPFPVFIMPQNWDWVKRLEKEVRNSLILKIEKNRMDRNPTSIMANLAFFYSHDGAEMQSPYLFLVRLASKYEIVSEEELWQALNLDSGKFTGDEAAAKKAAEEALKQKSQYAFSPTAFRALLKKAVLSLGEKVDTDPKQWLMPYIRDKFLAQDEQALVVELLAPIQVGYVTNLPLEKSDSVTCRICGIQSAGAEDKSILMGQNTHKFHNQSTKQRDEKEPKVCLRCAMCTYLMVKLLGSEAVGQPQVPKTYNLVFHYGKHSNEEMRILAQKIDRLWDLIAQHRKAKDVHYEVAKAHKALVQRGKGERDPQERAMLGAELVMKEEELEKAQTAVTQIEDEVFSACPWMRDNDESPLPAENPALDIISNFQLSENMTEWHVLGLGMGSYRLMLFVLPQIRAPGKKEHDFAQRRFSNSWITITAFLSFLHNLCGCNGPFYYQSLPTLTTDAFQQGMFYIGNRPVSALEAQNKYKAIYQLAWRLVREHGSEGFVKKVMLAERLLEDPLGTFSGVMRNSPILGQREGSYKKLKSNDRHDWGVQDLTEYSRFIQQLAEL